jgi:NAD(P)-dependent dehydrogenase (short-subunit alcohol dehydrogenase family)
MANANQTYLAAFSLKGKNAIVTGGAGMLGEHICRGLSESGANVAVVDIDGSKASQLARALEIRYSVSAIGISCDISDEESVKNMRDVAISKFNYIDILINNAASKSKNLDAFFAPLEHYSLAQWKEVMSVNIDGMFLVAKEIGAIMAKKNHGGSIVQISSIYGSLGPDQRIYENAKYLNTLINTPAVYCASKGAVISLSNYLATYWAKSGIRVNTVSPGGIESGQNSDFIKNYSERIPLNRMARPEEIVGIILFLSGGASSYITGQNIFVDGGLSCW